MPEQIRSTTRYLFALLPPLIIAALWPSIETIHPFPASVFFLGIAIVARYFGYRPALLCTAVSAFAFWKVVLGMAGHPLSMQVGRVALFILASLVVAGLSRQRSKDVQAVQERLQSLYDTAMDAILCLHANGHFVDANPAASELLGYSREELAEQSVGDLSRPEDRQNAIDVFRRIRDEGKTDGEAVIVRKDGSTRDIEYRVIFNTHLDTQFVMMHDVTARKDAERSLHNLSARLLQLQDEERRRIARQLHDTTAQSLAAIRLNLFKISRSSDTTSAIRETIEESVALTDQSITEVRTLSYLLHPPMIEEVGLLPTLHWFVRGFEQRSGIASTLEADEIGRLPQELETAVFRIVQEALTNIQRHSGSAVARIRLTRRDHSLQLEVQDEGQGMPQELLAHQSALLASGIGIAGIQQRVSELGGEMEFQSADHGTRLVVTLPVPEM